MEYTLELKRKINSQIPNGELIIYDLFITFARFECALKNTERFLNPQRAEPLWDKFSETISNNFNPDSIPELRIAVDFILNEPPRKQIIRDGRLDWESSRLDENASITRKLCVYIRRVRNNLLHGGKFNGNYDPESRNYQLITYSTVILNNWVELDHEVRRIFLSDINP